jgi:phosphoribosylaminoimidazolecarboxamide formyltransferase/IMP cyclohydrolase
MSAMLNDPLRVRRALISVSDKTGLAELGQGLAKRGVEIVSTGGSARTLNEAGVSVTEVERLTGFPEILGGRVKTLIPAIHGGILGRRDDPAHIADMERHGISPIDLVAVNLYPFEDAVARDAAWDDAIEMIDIGGPALIRAAAKNHRYVAVLTDPTQYAEALAVLTDTGGTTLAMRRRLAAAAFARTAAYDATIAGRFAREQGDVLPERMTLTARRLQLLRYGENPHQHGALYVTERRPGIARAVQVQGKELSYNNIADADAALTAVAEFVEPAVVIVKHGNPCGAAVASTIAGAWSRALRCDPVSAFGGVVAANRLLDASAAEAISEIFTEVIVVPDADEAARRVLARRRNLRLLVTSALPSSSASDIAVRSINGGLLVQTADASELDPTALKIVTRRPPSEAELTDLRFAFRICKHVKSNAVVFARDGATTGIGAGQMSRVDAVRIAAWKGVEAAREAGLDVPLTQGSVLASDAFFPFADGLEAAIAAGARAVIQPGGAVRDQEVIAAADAAGIAMVFTGLRHFRH